MGTGVGVGGCVGRGVGCAVGREVGLVVGLAGGNAFDGPVGLALADGVAVTGMEVGVDWEPGKLPTVVVLPDLDVEMAD